MEGARLLVPMRMAVRTMVGMSVMDATHWHLHEHARATPALGQARAP